MMQTASERLGPARRVLLSHVLLLLAIAAAPAAASASASEPHTAREWLSKMIHATHDLNYDGVFVYRSGEEMQSMRIIHRADKSGGRERLVALSGTSREVLRDNSHVTCIIPDSQSVVVAKSRTESLLPTGILSAGDAITKHYTLSTRKGQRVAGRRTQLVAVEPRDHYRYGYRLYVDRATGLLLKSELLDERRVPVEQIVYTNISLPQSIPDSLLKPSISGQGYTWYTVEGSQAQREEKQEKKDSGWQVKWLPPGFVMSALDRDEVPTSRTPVEQLVYSDGVASLSVFVEHLAPKSEPLNGTSRMGAVNAYGRMIDGFQVTVFGEVPQITVEQVGKSITHK